MRRGAGKFAGAGKFGPKGGGGGGRGGGGRGIKRAPSKRAVMAEEEEVRTPRCPDKPGAGSVPVPPFKPRRCGH